MVFYLEKHDPVLSEYSNTGVLLMRWIVYFHRSGETPIKKQGGASVSQSEASPYGVFKNRELLILLPDSDPSVNG